MSKISKRLTEVWEWKERAYDQVKHLPTLKEKLKAATENAKKHSEELLKNARITTRSNR